MGGAMSVTPLIIGASSQWTDTVDWTVRCDWLQVASVATLHQFFATFADASQVLEYIAKSNSYLWRCQASAVSSI